MALTDLLEDLVAFPTTSGDISAANACLDYVSKRLETSSMHVEIIERNRVPSLVASSRGNKSPKVLLQAHIDVVPAPGKLYDMQQTGDKLKGRGVYDMKFAAACYLQLADELRHDMPDYDIGIMLTSDEEVGGEDGVGYLLEQGYGADVCILPDGGANWQLEISCKGVWLIKLLASGKAAHGAHPWEGDNAIDRLVQALAEIKRVFGKLNEDRCSVTLSTIKGGEAINQVPAKAEATLDMRFTDTKHYEDLRAKIEDIAKRHGLEIDELAKSDVCETNVKQPEIARFMEIAEEVRGVPLGTKRSCGATDARYFIPKGIPTIIVRPTGWGAHSDDEWIDKKALEEFYEILKRYVTEVAKVG